MGRLIDGIWTKSSIVSSDKEGGYQRVNRSFLSPISDDHPSFKPESGRYHLYVSYACPWAHRVLIYLHLKELVPHVSVSVVHPDMLENGWTFSQDFPHTTGDKLYGYSYLYELYQHADPHVSTSVTVPVLWDTLTKTIVNNESSQIIRLFNSAFNHITGNTDDYYQEKDHHDIDALNTTIYDTINNGVYCCGFAHTQDVYDNAITQLFHSLDDLDALLCDKQYLLGDTMTEADIRLIPTLLRFDPVYVTHFKCNVKRMIDYPHLFRYITDLRRHPAIHNSTFWDHIKRHYFYSHDFINPYRIIPKGPGFF